MSTHHDDLTPEQLKILIQVYVETDGDTSGDYTFDIRKMLEQDSEGRPALKAIHALTGDLGLLEEATLTSVYLSEAGKQWAFRWLQKQYDPEPE